jgi:hypothetical protein
MGKYTDARWIDISCYNRKTDTYKESNVKIPIRYTDGEEDWYDYVTPWYINNKFNRNMLENFKSQHERDYLRDERDCSGTTKVVIKIQRSKGKIRVKAHCTIDC